jgi:hypothetical protein
MASVSQLVQDVAQRIVKAILVVLALWTAFVVIAALRQDSASSGNRTAPEVVQQRAERHDEDEAERYREEEREAAYRAPGAPAPVNGREP